MIWPTRRFCSSSPESEASRAAALESHERIARRTADLDIPVPPEVFTTLLRSVGADITADRRGIREKLKTTTVPLLIVSGDHDISFPVENWYSLSRQLPTAQHIVFPRTGHGPQHQHPEAVARYITTFINTTK